MPSTNPQTITVDGVTLTLLIERKRVKNINARLHESTLSINSGLNASGNNNDFSATIDLLRLKRFQPSHRVGLELGLGPVVSYGHASADIVQTDEPIQFSVEQHGHSAFLARCAGIIPAQRAKNDEGARYFRVHGEREWRPDPHRDLDGDKWSLVTLARRPGSDPPFGVRRLT